MTAADGTHAAASAVPTLVVLTLAYVLSQFFRTALAVVAPEVAQDLNLDPARLGLLSAAWFWAFAAAQIPIGVALDRWGPRRTVSLLFACAGLGCGLLAAARALPLAVMGQVLIGIGCAPVFMGTLMVLARFYDTRRFASLSALLLAIGSGGTILGTTPLAMVAEVLGWRAAFLAMALAVAVVALLVVLVVRDGPKGPPKAGQERLGAVLTGVGAVMRNRRLWAIVPLSLTGYAVLVTVRGLWAGPYLAEVHGLAPVPRGQALLVMSLAMIGGTLAYGWIEGRLDRRREPVLVGTTGAVLALAALAFVPPGAAVMASSCLAVFGWLGMTYALLMAQGRRFLAEHEIGRGLTFLNCACFTGAAALQSASGLVVELGTGPGGRDAATYRLLFLALGGVLTVAALVYARSEDRRG